MYILELYQNNYSKDLVAFDYLEEGKEFVSKIPGYTVEKEDNIEYEYFNPKNIPDYMEIIYNENIVPLSRFMFDPEENPKLVQNNGHNIYKIACKYKELNNIFSFEVQIKSLPFYVIIG